MQRILISLILFPIIVHAGQSNSQPKKPLSVKIMVEIIKQTTEPDSKAVTRETLAHVYNIFHEASFSFEPEVNQPSNDMQYSIPIFGCSGGSINGFARYRIGFEAIYNPKPGNEEQTIDEDSETALNDQFEQQCRAAEFLEQSAIFLRTCEEPIAKDNRAFSLNEFKEYETRLPNIIVKAGAYIIQD
jgi:hypothetical protein